MRVVAGGFLWGVGSSGEAKLGLPLVRPSCCRGFSGMHLKRVSDFMGKLRAALSNTSQHQLMAAMLVLGRLRRSEWVHGGSGYHCGL